jgi:hypothetical protein
MRESAPRTARVLTLSPSCASSAAASIAVPTSSDPLGDWAARRGGGVGRVVGRRARLVAAEGRTAVGLAPAFAPAELGRGLAARLVDADARLGAAALPAPARLLLRR